MTSRAPFAFLPLGHALSMLAQTTGAEIKNATPHGDRRLRQKLMVGGAGFEPKQTSPSKTTQFEQNDANTRQINTLSDPPSPVAEQTSALPAHSSGSSERPDHATFMPEDLAQVVAAWDHLSPAVKAGIVAMVAASKPA